MKKSTNFLFYLTLLTVFATVFYWVMKQGTLLQLARVTIKTPRLADPDWKEMWPILKGNLQGPLAIILLQISTILISARFFGFLCRKIGQPNVIGEIIAGIVLGPSLLGIYFPDVFMFLFPKKSLVNLQYLSQIGLILFMFIIGMEVNLKSLKDKAKDAIIISHASILIPFGLGMTLAYYLYMHYAPPAVSFISFSLFLGIAMSITAFPVLARIVQERGLGHTKIGAIVITCAAADDITAWCILAAVVAVVKAGAVISLITTLTLAVFYVIVMIKIVGPILLKVSNRQNISMKSKSMVALYFTVLILSSYATETIGIHALFGAFMAGIVMPAKAELRNKLIYKIEDVALVLLLPLFFVFTGLKTQINLLNSFELWKVAAIIVIVAFTGKFFGSALTARFIGQTWKDSFTIGALMNTRGLVEIVVLNIGYDLNILSPTMFAMLIIMALITTFMTGPILDLINRFIRQEEAECILLESEEVEV
jgi:Kef-type K+ transport system membrane component KefB